jgi:hypothetical protein
MGPSVFVAFSVGTRKPHGFLKGLGKTKGTALQGFHLPQLEASGSGYVPVEFFLFRPLLSSACLTLGALPTGLVLRGFVCSRPCLRWVGNTWPSSISGQITQASGGSGLLGLIHPCGWATSGDYAMACPRRVLPWWVRPPLWLPTMGWVRRATLYRGFHLLRNTPVIPPPPNVAANRSSHCRSFTNLAFPYPCSLGPCPPGLPSHSIPLPPTFQYLFICPCLACTPLGCILHGLEHLGLATHRIASQMLGQSEGLPMIPLLHLLFLSLPY